MTPPTSLTSPSSVPPPCAVPAFEPLHVRGARHRLRRALRRGRRAPALLLALTAGALAVAQTAAAPAAPPPPSAPARARPPAAAPLVKAPVRIADAATVRLLRPGDRVDVIAAPDSPLGADAEAHVVATGARVAEVPRPREARPDGGALVVLSMPRPTAAKLAGAGVTAQLALILC
ncbi:hypothetical protein [Streptomyces sp. NPDC002232]|uniref:hypothetical protein n=1 Tax=Streptomyces sp. NPDC002232 TaxID=3364640 RepID=UPI00368FEA06